MSAIKTKNIHYVILLLITLIYYFITSKKHFITSNWTLYYKMHYRMTDNIHETYI